MLSRLKQCLFEAIQEGFQALRKKIRKEKEEKNKEKENNEDAGSGSATAVESPEEWSFSAIHDQCINEFKETSPHK